VTYKDNKVWREFCRSLRRKEIEEEPMAKLTIEGGESFDVAESKRLVRALVEDAGVDQLHACGGKGRCTTCKVEMVEGEPDKMTKAEATVLSERGLEGIRLSCQMLCDRDMTVRVVSRLEGSGRSDAGSAVADEIEPAPVEWVDRG